MQPEESPPFGPTTASGGSNRVMSLLSLPPLPPSSQVLPQSHDSREYQGLGITGMSDIIVDPLLPFFPLSIDNPLPLSSNLLHPVVCRELGTDTVGNHDHSTIDFNLFESNIQPLKTLHQQLPPNYYDLRTKPHSHTSLSTSTSTHPYATTPHFNAPPPPFTFSQLDHQAHQFDQTLGSPLGESPLLVGGGGGGSLSPVWSPPSGQFDSTAVSPLLLDDLTMFEEGTFIEETTRSRLASSKAYEHLPRDPTLTRTSETQDGRPGGQGPVVEFSSLLSQRTLENLFKDCEPDLNLNVVSPPPLQGPCYSPIVAPQFEALNEIVEEENEFEGPSTEEVKGHDGEEEAVEQEWVLPPKLRPVAHPPSSHSTRSTSNNNRNIRPSLVSNIHNNLPPLPSITTTTTATRRTQRISRSTSASTSISTSTSTSASTPSAQQLSTSITTFSSGLPLDAPIQPRKYQITSRTSLKPIPKTLLRQNEQSLKNGTVSLQSLELEAEMRRKMNTLNARESRKRKLLAKEEKERQLGRLIEENDFLKTRVGELEFENEGLRSLVAVLEGESGAYDEGNVKRARRG